MRGKGIPPNQQRLLYDYGMLDDDHTLSDYNIPPGSILIWILVGVDADADEEDDDAEDEEMEEDEGYDNESDDADAADDAVMDDENDDDHTGDDSDDGETWRLRGAGA